MTLQELHAKVAEWDCQPTGSGVADSKYSRILDQLYYHSGREWRVYLPAEHPDFSSNYMERLATWIGNLKDETDQKILLEYALHISFFSHGDFAALYRTAFNRDITRWVASHVNANLDACGAEGFHDLVYYEIHNHTWFCPVTDSMDINEFYKVNHLKGSGHRPGFYTLQMLAESAGVPNTALVENIKYYMEIGSVNRLDRLVLLEDIVGSGSQCLNAVRWAVQSLRKPVLFIPLILCPNGVGPLQVEEQQSNGLLTVRPVVELRRSDLLGPERQGQPSWPIADSVEDLARRSAGQLGIDVGSAFGYVQTGCSLATFANTPDNSLPMIHRKSENPKWDPLFPRIYRG